MHKVAPGYKNQIRAIKDPRFSQNPTFSIIAPGNGHIINNPMLFVGEHHTMLQKLDFVIGRFIGLVT